MVSEPLLTPNASNIVHEHWISCMSPLLLESTACPLTFLGCLYAPTMMHRLCVDYLSLCQHCVNYFSSLELQVYYTRKTRAALKC
jgi:hypothetical protein